MNLAQFLDNWAKTHPVYDPKQDYQNVKQQDKILTWLKDGGESPLPTWPKIEVKNES